MQVHRFCFLVKTISLDGEFNFLKLCLVIHRTTGIPSERWSVKRPFQAVANKFNKNSTKNNNVVKISQTRQPQPPSRENWLLDSTPSPSTNNNPFASDLYRVEDISLTVAGRPYRPIGRPIKKQNNLRSRSSTNLALERHRPALVNYVKERNDARQVYYRKKLPLSQLEKDSYLRALELSRLPCETLSDPHDCHDLTELFNLPFDDFEILAGFPPKDCYTESVPLISQHQSGYYTEFSPSPFLDQLSEVGVYQLDHPDLDPELEAELEQLGQLEQLEQLDDESIPPVDSPEVKMTMRFIRVN